MTASETYAKRSNKVAPEGADSSQANEDVQTPASGCFRVAFLLPILRYTPLVNLRTRAIQHNQSSPWTRKFQINYVTLQITTYAC
jgi:hypothetical protein